MNDYIAGNPIRFSESCLCCGARERRFLSAVGRNFQKLDTVICTGCGLIHSSPIPSQEELDRFYQKKYRTNYKFTEKPHLKHILRYAPGALNRVKKLKEYITKDHKFLVDIGSGSGEFLYFANKAGFTCIGYEPHEGYAAFSAQTLKLNVENKTLEQAHLKAESVDIINLNHVLEHMRNPLETLCLLNQALKKGGLLLVDVPDISVSTHAPWTQFHYAHIYNFNYKTLRALLEKVGFEILNSDCKTTNFIARKVELKNTNGSISMPENYEHLWHILTTHTGFAHYKSKKPYARFLRKCYQYPREFIQTLFLNTPQKILDSFRI